MKYKIPNPLAFRRYAILSALSFPVLIHSASASNALFVEAGATGGDGSAKSPFGTIQEAVDAAAAEPGANDIKIATGEYVENIAIEDSDPVTLKGQGDVLIKHPDIDLENEEEPEDVIEAEGDVTFQNLSVEGLFIGEDLGGRGIDVKDGSFVFRNVSVFGTDGDSIRVRDFGELTIINADVSSLNADGFDIEDGESFSIRSSNANDCDDEGLEVDRVDSVEVVGGEFSGNGDDGIDIDDSTAIRVVNIYSSNNEGNGYQTEAEDREVESIELIGSDLINNGENGVQLVGEEMPIHFVSLRSNDSVGNVEFGYEILTLGEVVARGNKASDNGDNTLP